MLANKQLGDYGQKLAVDFLRGKGYLIVQENYFSRYGEIDIIAKEADQLVFVEVKTRTGTAYGLPEEAIDQAKIKKMLATIGAYLSAKEINNDNYRLDAVAIEIDEGRKIAKVRHHVNIG